MGSVLSNCKCKYCEYEEAYSDCYYKLGEEYCNCPRCGSSWGFGHYAENKHGKFDTKFEHAVMYGTKAYHCGGTTTEGIPEFEKDIEQNKNELEVAQYTFQKDGVWFVKDCLTGNIISWDDYEIAKRV